MTWPLTVAAIIADIALLGLAVWQSGRPRKDSLDARWIPWKFVILLAGAFLVYLAVHVANLMGVHTGDPNPVRPREH